MTICEMCPCNLRDWDTKPGEHAPDCELATVLRGAGVLP